MDGLVAARCKSEIFMEAAELWFVLEVSLEGSGEGMCVGWWLLLALLVDHSPVAHRDV